MAEDKGKAIKVKVFFTDDGDSDESLTSAATVAVTTSPLTVSLENEPDTPHDGQNPFTFELHFSEEFDLSYLTLKDDAFTVEGGEVTRARRIDRHSITPNIRWEITVRPTGDGEVPSRCRRPATATPRGPSARRTTGCCPTRWSSPSAVPSDLDRPVNKEGRAHRCPGGAATLS